MTTRCKMHMLVLCVFVSHVCVYGGPSYGSQNNPQDGGYGGQIAQQSLVEPQPIQFNPQPPQSVSDQYWWQDNSNSPFAQQQQNAPQSDATVQPMGICTAPVCPASSVCVQRQLCSNGFLITDASGQIDQQIQSIYIEPKVRSTSQHCGDNMICCVVPSCSPPISITNRPRPQPTNKPPVRDDIYEPQPSVTNIVRVPRPVTKPPMNNMMMKMGPMRSHGNCSAGLYCIERPECDRNGFIIQPMAVVQAGDAYLPGVPLLSCVVRKGNILDGVCCQQVHPNPQNGLD